MGIKLQVGVNDLKTWCIKNDCQILLEEWDYEKNKEKPSEVMYGMAKKVWWIGKDCGHSYQASLNGRTSNKSACPYCCKSHAKLLTGFNDLATTDPELLSKWDYEKNEDICPTQVMKGQHIKVWWKCEQGHSWQASVYHVVGGRGCPICRKERKTSFPEQAIFYYIKKVFPEAIPANRDILGGKEIDIYLPSIKTGIEFDGSNWHNDVKKDILKNELCKDEGVRLIRIRDVDCCELPKMDNIVIIPHVDYSDVSLKKCLKLLAKELGCIFDIDLKRDRTEIYCQFLKLRKENSLAEKFPKLLKEWDYEKNGDLSPYSVTKMSDKTVWWKCKKGHSWQSMVHARTKGSGCPVCNSNRFCKGVNDFKTIYPEISKYWDSEKNEIKPEEISAKKDMNIWWRCKYNHSFKMRIRTMIKNFEKKFPCPECNFERLAQKNDLRKDLEKHDNKVQRIVYQNQYVEEYTPKAKELENGRVEKKERVPNRYISTGNTLNKTNPEVLEDWDYENNNIKPEQLTIGSDKKVWWKCDKGHSYQASISNHVTLKRGCPYCSNRKVLEGFNDLKSQRPEVMPYWDYEKNNSLNLYPNKITAHSGVKAWWRCVKGHTRMATIYSYKPNSCPICDVSSPKKVLNIDTGEMYNSLAAAAKSCGLKSGDTISLCCQRRQETAGGFHWKYIEKSE